MKTLITPRKFESFGSSVLSKQMRGRLVTHKIPSNRLEARKMLRENCPLLPGVYGWIDENQQLIYVGKSKALRKRLLSYFAKTPSDNKMLRIRQHGHTLVWEPVSSELLALIREQELIYRFRPDFNKQGQPTRTQPAYLSMSDGVAPNAFVARRLNSKAAYSFGPIAGTNRLRKAVIAMNQVFHLRDCPDKTQFEFSNQLTLFDDPKSAQCIRFELGTCPAPCAARCSRIDYSANVEAALSFLTGKDASAIEIVETTMYLAAQKEAFERAATLRDYLTDLKWLYRRLQILRKAETQLNGILPIQAPRKRMGWMVMRGGRMVYSATRPDRPERARKLLQILEEIASQPATKPVDVLHMNLQVIVMSWLRKHPDMTQTIMGFDEAIQFCKAKSTSSRKAKSTSPPSRV